MLILSNMFCMINRNHIKWRIEQHLEIDIGKIEIKIEINQNET